MKIVINTCYGGYSISPLALKELARRKGRECYFFTNDYVQISTEEAENSFLCSAYSVDNPQNYKLNERDADGSYRSANERAEKISLSGIVDNRCDPDLIAVIECLGRKANGKYAALKIVEIPDDIKWQIDDYDGIETIHEAHQVWS